jgi:beta-N-acetylhexosaminidase
LSRRPASSAALAARLTWGAVRGIALDAEERARLALGLGGVVLFERNVESPDQVRALIRSIRAATGDPIRIAVDQEGGYVTRVGDPLTCFPGPMAIAATRSTRVARAVAAASAVELRALGIDTVLAPVLDVAAVPENPSIGTRSFGDDPLLVARLGASMVRGYLDGGLIPVPKHFPGHGRTGLDSHVASPLVAGSIHELLARDLPPFAAAVEAGAPALMTAHVAYEAFADGLPASLSPAATALARRTIRFDGLLLTDALVMDSITGRMPLEEAGVAAILAGADAAMAIEGQGRVLEGLATAIDRGRLPRGRIREALRRADVIDRLAASLADGAAAGSPAADEASTRVAHDSLAREVAARSITLVAGEVGGLRVDGGVLVVDVAGRTRSPVDHGGGGGAVAGAALAAALGSARSIAVHADDATAADAVMAAAEGAGAVVVLTRDAFADPSAAALLATLGRRPGSSVHVALRNPLDLVLEGPATRIAAYADTPATIDAVAGCLSGRERFRGHLPVRLPERRGARTQGVAGPAAGVAS